MPYLAYWYEVPTAGVSAGIQTSWSVADGEGHTVAGVHLSGQGLGQPLSYSLVDMSGSQVLGYAEPGLREARKDPSLKADTGSCLTLSRSEGLADPLATASLALPLATHQYLFRRDQRTMERRRDMRDRGQVTAGRPGRIL